MPFSNGKFHALSILGSPLTPSGQYLIGMCTFIFEFDPSPVVYPALSDAVVAPTFLPRIHQARGEYMVLLGLLEDVQRFYDGLPPHPKDTKAAVPYLPDLTACASSKWTARNARYGFAGCTLPSYAFVPQDNHVVRSCPQ